MRKRMFFLDVPEVPGVMDVLGVPDGVTCLLR
jgi:hypothetical protein